MQTINEPTRFEKKAISTDSHQFLSQNYEKQSEDEDDNSSCDIIETSQRSIGAAAPRTV